MTDAEKVAAYDDIAEIVKGSKETVAYYSDKKDMGPYTETVEAHAFRKIAKTFFADAS